MKAWEVLGYVFAGEIYCTTCVVNPTECGCGELDENGVCESNCHGYGPNPIFASDAERGEVCGACGDVL